MKKDTKNQKIAQLESKPVKLRSMLEERLRQTELTVKKNK
jgi:hypothetical protein